MGASQEEIKFFGLLVLKGHLRKEDVLRVLEKHAEESKKRCVSLADVAVSMGVIERSRLEHLKRVGGENLPEIPGLDILAKIGVGGSSVVFRAREKKTGRDVALKVMHEHLVNDEVGVKRFVTEAKLLIDFNHENIVKGLKLGTIQGNRLVFVMEFVDGDSLLDLLHKGNTFPEDAALYIVLQAARAIEYMRARGVLHRDIKPANLLLKRDNTVKLIDLGFATSMAGALTEPHAAAGDTTLGTVHYISPEQARGQTDLDVRSDIYSLGATLYQLVLGKLPFEGSDNQEVLARQILDSLSSSELKSRQISPHMHYFIEKMMAKEREIRYQDPLELIADIEAQIRGKKTLAYNPGAAAGSAELLQKPYAEPDPEKARQDKARLDEIRRRRGLK
ncbi:MAG: serine/threonine-protein kinase [Planctomycetota bacterium]